MKSKTARTSSRLDTLGVSVYHLCDVFLEEKVCGATAQDGSPLSRFSKIYEIEDLQGPPGVIRQSSADTICRLDGRKGSSYVHTLDGEDHVGEATHMLSYAWSYTIGDIVETLINYCQTNNLPPKRTYIWICCLCINQHRVVEQSQEDQQFLTLFGARVKRIGHVVAMMAPWKEPVYLTRVWCIFEIYTAEQNGCVVDIVMPPNEKTSMERDILAEGGGIHVLYQALGKTKVQNAKATVDSDRRSILRIIKSSVGYLELNKLVNNRLRWWMNLVITGVVEARENTNDGKYADFCNKIGSIFKDNGENASALQLHETALSICLREHGTSTQTSGSYSGIGFALRAMGDHERALENFSKGLLISRSEHGKDHPETAIFYSNVGLCHCSMGDCYTALEEHRKCLTIQKDALGKDHPDTATTYHNIGLALDYGCRIDPVDLDDALANYKKCLAIRELVLGEHHVDTATSHNYIGSVLASKGRFREALVHYRKCLNIQETVLGNDHHDTARTYFCIGVLRYNQRRHSAALVEFRKCLAIRRGVLGEDHLATQNCEGWIRHTKEIRYLRCLCNLLCCCLPYTGCCAYFERISYLRDRRHTADGNDSLESEAPAPSL